jgi:hypothetical protein
MGTKNSDRYSLIEAYRNIKECECNQMAAATNPASISGISIHSVDSGEEEEKVDMVMNNLININNKTAELVQSMQNALNANENIEQWVSEKLAVVANTIGTIADYYAKYKTVASGGIGSNIQQPTMPSSASLKLEPMTVATSFPLKTNMPPMTTSF